MPVPILTVSRATRPLTFQRILFATDLSASSAAGFNFALDLAQMMGSDLIVMHAVEKVSLTYAGCEMDSYVDEGNIEEARKALGNLLAGRGDQKIKIEPIVVEGVAAEEIVRNGKRTLVQTVTR